MLRFRKFLACAMLMSTLATTRSADAAIVSFTDYSAYIASATGIAGVNNVESVIDFESVGLGNALTSVGDVSFASDSPAGLRPYFGGTNTPSEESYVGGGNFAFRDLSSEEITISFGANRSAAGIFVVHNTGAGGVSLQTGANSVPEGLTPFQTYATTAAYFLGFVDDTGAASIASIVLQGTGSSSYFFDDQTSFTPVAVPEPTSIVALGLLSSAWVMRRRRQRS